MSNRTKSTAEQIDRLGALLLIGRLPSEEREMLLSQIDQHPAAELASCACMMYVGMGIVWPLPCLAKGLFGGWFSVKDVAPC